MLSPFFSYFVLFRISQKRNLIIVYKLHAGHDLQLLSELNHLGHERSTRDVTLSDSDHSGVCTLSVVVVGMGREGNLGSMEFEFDIT